MIGTPTRLWTCDKCEQTASVVADSGPMGWHIVSLCVIPEVRDEKDKSLSQHWCESCVVNVFGPPGGWA